MSAGIPDFPQTIPPNTFLGRTAVNAGPAQALPITTLQGLTGTLTVFNFSGTATYINVKDPAFGAIGDGVHDDTANINSAIAAFNGLGKGILYFPAGTYKVSSSLTTITAAGLVVGEGSGNPPDSGHQTTSTLISFTSNNTALFTTATHYLEFRDMEMQSGTSPAPAAGCSAILVTGTDGTECVSFNHIVIFNFYDAIDLQTGQTWHMDHCLLDSFLHYGIRCRNIHNPDGGGWMISNSIFVSGIGVSAASLRLESGGGDRIVNCFFIGGTNAVDVVPPLGVTTVDLNIANCNIENFAGIGINVNNTAGSWNSIIITGCELANFGPSATNAIALNTADSVTISNCIIGAGNPGIGLTNSTNVYVSNITTGAGPLQSLFGPATSGPFPVNDGTGGVGGGQFFTYQEVGIEQRLIWSGKSAGWLPEFTVQSTSIQPASIFVKNSVGDVGLLEVIGPSPAIEFGSTQLQALHALFLQTNGNFTSGGPDPVVVRAGGNTAAAEVVRFLPTGNVQFSNAANFSTNGAVATVLGSLGPTGSRTTVQKWLTVKDGAGNPFYIPCF